MGDVFTGITLSGKRESLRAWSVTNFDETAPLVGSGARALALMSLRAESARKIEGIQMGHDTDENRLRRFEIRGIDQQTGATQGEPERFGFADLYSQLSDPNADAFITIDQLLALGLNDSLRFGGAGYALKHRWL